MWVCVGRARPTVRGTGIAKRHRDNAIVTDRRVHFVFQNVRNRDNASVTDRRFHFVFQNVRNRDNANVTDRRFHIVFKDGQAFIPT